jgi:hypothetical protein
MEDIIKERKCPTANRNLKIPEYERGAQGVLIFPDLHGTRNVIVIFTGAQHWNHFEIHAIHPHILASGSYLALSFHP